MTWHTVAVKSDHLERLVGKPLDGVIELIWNAIDADATQVSVALETNELGGIQEVRVVDNGVGMPHELAVEGFTGLGGSWKAIQGRSPGNRPLHGKAGHGRWRAFAIGGRVRWETVAQIDGRRMLTTIEGYCDRLDGFEISATEETDRCIGTTVFISAIAEPQTALAGAEAVHKLTAQFALIVTAYDLSITYDGVELDPVSHQIARSDYNLELPPDLGPAQLTIIEWNLRGARILYLCDEHGTPLWDTQPRVQAPGFEYTAYLFWAGFAKHMDVLAVVDFEPAEIVPVLERARERIRAHFRERAADAAKQVIEEWKQENLYPYEGPPASIVEQAERQLFDVVAFTASSAVNSSRDARGKGLTLGLIKVALENDPGSLHEVLGHVLDLPPDRVEDLRQLLQHTSLASIVTAAKTISNRLQFLRGLEELVFDPETRGMLLERSQLHRILAGETWIFGEEYSLTADDESLDTLLTKHMKILGRERMADDSEVLDLDGRRRIIDLMLGRSIEQARNRREHLVVELKAPKVTLKFEHYQQILAYAFAVVGDERFDKTNVRWEFVLVSTDVDESMDQIRHQEKRPPGLAHEAEHIQVWVRTWGEIIEACSHRLKFVQKALDYSPRQADALEYLRRTYAKYLPDHLQDAAQ